jgi:1-acyl-sn-glycerol-3-phosphate acyltransferase
MNYLQAGKNWLHVGGRAVVYGTISVTTGVVTRRHDIGQWCMRSWCEGSLAGIGIRHHIQNEELLEREPQCVYVANHLSQLDILLIGSYLRNDYRWLAKSSLFKIPFLGWHLSLSGHVPVYRGEQQSKNEKLAQRIHAVVKQGASLLFFPEGTRSRDGRLQTFRIGAFRTAVREGLPIVPLVVRGTHELFVPGSVDLAVRADRQCSITVLPSLRPPDEGTEKARAETLRDLTHAAYVSELSKADDSQL